MNHYSSTEMRRLYDEWQSSTQSKATFARAQDIAPSTFYYWTRKFEQAQEERRGFQQIRVAGSSAGQPTAVIHYPTGARLELYGVTEAAYLKSLVA